MHAINMQTRLDGLDDFLMHFDITRRPCKHHMEIRTKLPCFANTCARVDPKFFRFVRRSNCGSEGGSDRRDDRGLSAIFGMVLLLHRGEVAAEIDEYAA